MLLRSALVLAVVTAGCLNEPAFSGAGGAGDGSGGGGAGDGGGAGAGAPGMAFPPAGATLALREPVATDLDGDGRTDLLLASATADDSGGLYLALDALSSRVGRFHAHLRPTSGLPLPALTAHAADLDGDGVRDLLVLAGDGAHAHLLAYRGRSAIDFDPPLRKDLTTWFAASAMPGPAEPNGSVAAMQLDGAGPAEIVVAGRRLVFAFSFPGFQSPAFEDAERTVVPGQVTGGGWNRVTRAVVLAGAMPRLLVAEQFNVSVFEPGPLDTLLDRRHLTTPGAWPLGVTALRDLDGDGDDDLLAVAPGSSALMVLFGWPDDRYARWPTCFETCDFLPDRVVAADLDRSGRPELITLGPMGSGHRLKMVEDAYLVGDEIRTNSATTRLDLATPPEEPWLLAGDGSPDILLLGPTGAVTCLRWTPGSLAPCP